MGDPANWQFPAPTGLRVTKKSANGVSIAFNPVKGPQGQVPSTYTIATYDSSGKLVDEFDSGETSTEEFGKGGKGLPKGSYHINVWANGGPVAPAHATVDFTLTG